MSALTSLPPLALLAESVTGLSATWEQVIGRMHPAFVHLPLGLFVAAGIFAVLGGRTGKLNGTVRACLVLGLLVSVAAAASGWLFAFHDEGDDPALDTHRWSGVATVVVGLVVLLVGLGAAAESGRGKAFRWGAVLLALLTAYTGHEGGELVWGSGFATEPLSARDDDAGAAATPSDAQTSLTASNDTTSVPADGAPDDPTPVVDSAPPPVDFVTQIQPIFEASCYKCHGPEKARGRLRLDAREFVFSGDNPTIVPGEPENSETYQRVILPVGHEDVMPEKGDHLTPEQTELIRRWIEEGAEWPA